MALAGACAHLPPSPSDAAALREPSFAGTLPVLASCPPPGGVRDSVGVYFTESQVVYPSVPRAGDARDPAIGGTGTGTVVMRFIVDTAGRPEQGSVAVVRSDAPARAARLLVVVPKLNRTPAWIGHECRVRQLVEQTFEFR